MKKFLQKKLKNEKGMTLIELLAVIVIIAIIAAIAIPAIANIIGNSRVGAAKSDAQNVLSAAQLYLSDNDNAFDGTPGNITQAELVNEGYLEDLGGFEGVTVEADQIVVDELTPGGDLTISGTATVGGVTVVFNNATRDTIEATPNGLGNNPADTGAETFTGTPVDGTATGTVAVTR